MKLELKNIGKIRDASIDIKGIAVIAGENNTGKSTVGKSLYWLFSGLYQADENIEQDRKATIENILWWALRRFEDGSSIDLRIAESTASRIIELGSTEVGEIEKVIRDGFGPELSTSVEWAGATGISGLVGRVVETLSMSMDEALSRLLNRGIDSEFNGQISPLGQHCSSQVKLIIKSEPTDVLIEDNEVKRINGLKNLGTKIIYIDDPFTLDELSERFIRRRSRRAYILNHRDSLLDVLSRDLLEDHRETTLFDEISIDNRLSSVMRKLDDVGVGFLRRSNRGEVSYTDKSIAKPLDARNLSTGLKTFVVLRTLIESGTIVESSTIILDEPEIHLHPEWQLVFAEIVVLLQKELDLHVVINTHSPYFLYAIEMSSARHLTADKCTYYLAENENGESSVIKDVTENTEIIYQKLAAPLQRLQDEEYGL